MNRNISCNLHYLRAIQRIPGDTASEKFNWLGILASKKAKGDDRDVDDRDVDDRNVLSRILLPILQMKISIKNKNYEEITSALLSEDSTIVTQALKASWFFDGSHEIVNVTYFMKYIFPYVSLNTRIRIIKTLAHKVKNPKFAKEMFEAVESIYDYQIVLPLIVVCSEDFAYETIVKKKFMLPIQMLDKIFCKNMNLGIRLLKSFIFHCHIYKPIRKCCTTNHLSSIIRRYSSLLLKVVKKQPLDFVDIVEKIKGCPNMNVLDGKCAVKFLKVALHRVANNPHLYMHILPSEVIIAEVMQVIFPNLMRHHIREKTFKVDTMLDYLKDYPENERLHLLRETYKEVRQSELLDNWANLTPALLRLLPVGERMLKAMQMITCSSNDAILYEIAYICYFPTMMVKYVIKYKLSTALTWDDKFVYILQWIYTCKINKDDDELCNALAYIKKHMEYNDVQEFQKIINSLVKVCDLPNLNTKEFISYDLFEIIQLFYERYGYLEQNILENMLHFRCIHEIAIEDLIEILIISNNKIQIEFNVLKDYPNYERRCLEAIMKRIETITYSYRKRSWHRSQNPPKEDVKQAKSQEEEDREVNKEKEKKDQSNLLCQLVIAMYDFNERCKKSRTRIQRMKILEYPWLLSAIQSILYSEEEITFYKKMKATLRKQEPEMYRNCFPLTLSSAIANVTSVDALHLLKRNRRSILSNWKEYLTECKRNCYQKQAQRFVRATRWYQHIPIKFAKSCIDDLNGMDVNEKPPALVILNILLDGDELSKLIDSFLPVEMEEDTDRLDARNNRELALAVNVSMRFSNPPVPLELVTKLYKGNYSSMMLKTLTVVSRRTSLLNVYLFKSDVLRKDYSLLKHWTLLMYLILSRDDFINFIQETWKTDTGCDQVQNVLYEAIHMTFREYPRQTLRSLSCINTWLTVKNERLLSKMKLFDFTPHEYIDKYFDLWLDTIQRLSKLGLQTWRIKQHTLIYLEEVHMYKCYLSENYIENILREFLFHSDYVGISSAVQCFTLQFILPHHYILLLKIMNKIFPRIKKDHLNKCSFWEYPLFYPKKNIVCNFFDEFVITYLKSPKLILHETVMNYLLETILMVLSSNVKSYLLLTYLKALKTSQPLTKNESDFFKRFGLQIGKLLPSLVDIFTLYLLPFMAKLLDYFLHNVHCDSNYSDVITYVIHGIQGVNNEYNLRMAVLMLSLQKYQKEYNSMILFFQSSSDFAVIGIINNYLHKIKCYDISFDNSYDQIY